MPIVKQHGNSHCTPGAVYMQGIFVFFDGGDADPSRSETPGLTLVNDSTGNYTITFTDGATPGITVPILRHAVDPAQPNPRFIEVVDPASLLPGSSGFSFQFRSSGGSLLDPTEDSVITYQILRMNTSTVYQ